MMENASMTIMKKPDKVIDFYCNNVESPLSDQRISNRGSVEFKAGHMIIPAVRLSQKVSVEKKLQRMAEFQFGWHFGEGLPIRVEAMSAAHQLHKLGKALGLATDVFPHEEGDVSIMFKASTANRYLEVLCLPDMKYSLTLEEGTKHPFTLIKENEKATLFDVLTELLSFPKPEALWNFSDSFILTNTVPISNDLHRSVSKTLDAILTEPSFQKTNAGSVSLTLIAYANTHHPNQSANTSWRNMDKPALLESL